MSIREKKAHAKFHAYLSASQYLKDIVGARIVSPDESSEDETLMNQEYLQIAERLEKTALKYRAGFE